LAVTFETGAIDFGFDRAKIDLAGGTRAVTSPHRGVPHKRGSGEKGERLKTIFLV
jgi:hypothetical protein